MEQVVKTGHGSNRDRRRGKFSETTQKQGTQNQNIKTLQS